MIKIFNCGKRVNWYNNGKIEEVTIDDNDSEFCEIDEKGTFIDLKYHIRTKENKMSWVFATDISEIETNSQLLLIEDKDQYAAIVKMLEVMNVKHSTMYGYKAMIREEAIDRINTELEELDLVKITEVKYDSMISEMEYKLMEDEILDDNYIGDMASEIVSNHLDDESDIEELSDQPDDESDIEELSEILD